MAVPLPDKPWLSALAVQEATGLSYPAVLKLAVARELETRTRPGTSFQFARASVAEWLAKNAPQSEEPKR